MIGFLIILFGITMLYIASTTRLEGYVKMLVLQGVILFILAILNIKHFDDLNAYLIIFETLLVKAIIIPWFLIKIIRKNEISREIEPYISNFNFLFIVSLIFIFGFFISFWAYHFTKDVHALFFGISISTIMTGLFIIVSRKKIITHVMGFMMMENGIFLLSLSVAKEMPFIVSLGILLDVFMAIFLLGLFVNKIQSTFDELHIDHLTNLKD